MAFLTHSDVDIFFDSYTFLFFWQELFYASLEKVSVIFECVCFLPLCDDDEERKFLTGKMSQNLSFYLNKRS